MLDEVDRRIVYALQRDARNSTTTALAEEVGVAPSTVSNRIAQLEDDGIVLGYNATVDYERAGLPLHVLVSGAVPTAQRATAARQLVEVPGVVSVRELLAGSANLSVEAVARSADEFARIADSLDELGVRIQDAQLIRTQRTAPLTTLVEEPGTGQEPDQ